MKKITTGVNSLFKTEIYTNNGDKKIIIFNEEFKRTFSFDVQLNVTNNCKLAVMSADTLENLRVEMFKMFGFTNSDDNDCYDLINLILKESLSSTISILYINTSNVNRVNTIRNCFKDVFSETIVPIGYGSENQYHFLIDLRKLHSNNPYRNRIFIGKNKNHEAVESKLKEVLDKNYSRIKMIKKDIEKILNM